MPGAPDSATLASATLASATLASATLASATPASATPTSTDDLFAHPAGSVSADRLASHLMTLLRSDTSNDQRLVWRALVAMAPENPLSPRRQQARDAGRLCWSDLCEADAARAGGAPLSEREYALWLASDPMRKRSWPSVSSMRKWAGGSWVDVQDLLGQAPSRSMRGRRLAGRGAPYTTEELEEQVAECRRQLGLPGPPVEFVVWLDYRKWAEAERAKPVAARFRPRMCAHLYAFIERFGTWPEAVAASGGSRESAEYLRSVRTARGRRRLPTEEEVDQALQAVAVRLGAAPSKMQYEAVAAEMKREGHPDVALLVAAKAVERVYESWSEGLLHAGLVSRAEALARAARGTPKRSDEELLEAFALALMALGPDVSSGSYERAAKGGTSTPGGQQWPSRATLHKQFGGWKGACDRVHLAHPEVALCWAGLRARGEAS